MNRNIRQKIDDKLFREYAQKISVFLKSSQSKGSNFDPFRKTGYVITKSNSIYINAIVRDISPEKLILKEMGLTVVGSKELLIKKKDVNAIRISQKIVIDGINYVIYNEALGNKLLIFQRPFGYSRIIIFREEK